MVPQKTVVYTSIINNYDVLVDPKIVSPNVDYICFTDTNNHSTDVWETRLVKDHDLTPSELNRKIKILAHEYLDEYDYSLYVDGNVQIIGDITDLIDRYQKFDFAAPTHFLRDCVYEEGEALIDAGIGNVKQIRRQIARYQKQGLPENVGLSANSTLFRWHTRSRVQSLMKSWWEEFQQSSGRDQLSLPYVAWRENSDYKFIHEGPRLESQYYRLHPHIPSGPKRNLTKMWVLARAHREEKFRYLLIHHLIGFLNDLRHYSTRSIEIARREGLTELLSRIQRKGRNSFWPKFKSSAIDITMQIGDKYGLIGPDIIYSPDYYTKRRNDPMRSEAHQISKILMEEFQPESVIDFGCAIGAYLEIFHESGFSIKGVEGNKSAIENAVIPKEFIDHHDLRSPYKTGCNYDLVLSIEVAEHLPEEAADIFVSTLCSAGRPIVMTAATPGQGGTHHINEQPRKYWKKKFEENGYQYNQKKVNSLREKIDVNIFDHVSDNLFVFE